MKNLTFIFAILLFASCADLDVRRGAVGENCEGADTDCRDGLVCNAGECALSDTEVLTCDQVCSRFAECGGREDGCESDCRATVQDWVPAERDTFLTCLINDRSCNEISTGDAPQLCFDDLNR